MPRLSPGQSSGTLRAARLRLDLDTVGGTGVTWELSNPSNMELRRMRPDANAWVVEAPSPAEAVLSLVAVGGPAARMSGEASLQVRTLAVVDSGQPTRAGVAYELEGLVIEGRTRVAVLALSCDDDQFWVITSLLPRQVAPAGHPGVSSPTQTNTSATRSSHESPTLTSDVADLEYVRTARHLWGDTPRLNWNLLTCVDRSASMAWAFAGIVDEVCSGVEAIAGVALDGGARLGWATYGSGASEDGLVTVPRPREMRPELFASGSDAVAALRDARLYAQWGMVLLVCDRLPSELRNTDVGGPVAVLLVGASAWDGDWPREELQLRASLETQGIAVYPVPDRPGQATSLVTGLLADHLRRADRLCATAKENSGR